MDGPASINTLPAEMHIAIAELVDNESFLNLRLASPGFSANSIDVFAKRFFADRRHLYTTQSLIALRDISSRPVFARHVEAVEFIVVGVEEGYYPEENKQAASDWYRSEKENLDRQQVKLLSDIFRNFDKLGVAKNVKIGTDLWEKKSIEDDDDDDDDTSGFTINEEASGDPMCGASSLLVKAGARLKQDTWNSHGGAHGVTSLLKKIWPWASRAAVREGDIDCAANALLTALAETRHHVKTLDLAYKSKKKLRELSTKWNNRSPQGNNLIHVFSTIERLNIGVEGKDALSSILPLLAAAANLVTISFDVVDSSHFDDLALSPSWKKLRILFLHGPQRHMGRVKRLVEQIQQEKYEVVGIRYPNPYREYALKRASSIPPHLDGRRLLLPN